MWKKMREKAVDVAERRLFLGRLSMASAALLGAVIGLPKSSNACPFSCCTACGIPSINCSGCVCEWSWTCCTTADDLGYQWRWYCRECYQDPIPPGSECPACGTCTQEILIGEMYC
jgi:hypothetical protein